MSPWPEPVVLLPPALLDRLSVSEILTLFVSKTLIVGNCEFAVGVGWFSGSGQVEWVGSLPE